MTEREAAGTPIDVEQFTTTARTLEERGTSQRVVQLMIAAPSRADFLSALGDELARIFQQVGALQRLTVDASSGEEERERIAHAALVRLDELSLDTSHIAQLISLIAPAGSTEPSAPEWQGWTTLLRMMVQHAPEAAALEREFDADPRRGTKRMIRFARTLTRHNLARQESVRSASAGPRVRPPTRRRTTRRRARRAPRQARAPAASADAEPPPPDPADRHAATDVAAASRIPSGRPDSPIPFAPEHVPATVDVIVDSDAGSSAARGAIGCATEGADGGSGTTSHSTSIPPETKAMTCLHDEHPQSAPALKPTPGEFLTVTDAAKLLRTTVEALRARCRRAPKNAQDHADLGGGFVAHQFGRTWRVRFPE